MGVLAEQRSSTGRFFILFFFCSLLYFALTGDDSDMLFMAIVYTILHPPPVWTHPDVADGLIQTNTIP